MYNMDGEPLSIKDMEESIGMKIMLTHYVAFWKALPQQYKTEMTSHKKSFDVKMPLKIKWILKDNKGGSQIRIIWTIENTKTPPVGETKWVNELQNDNNNDPTNWTYLYILPFKCKVNARTKYFQYQILHRTLITNKKLKQFSLIPEEKCYFCDETETISYMLYDCPDVKYIWKEALKWIEKSTRVKITSDKASILLGEQDNKLITNLVILLIKHIIYQRKWNNERPSLLEIKFAIKKH